MTRPAPQPERLSIDEARRIALRAQGFPSRRLSSREAADRRVPALFDQLGVLQIDSVTTVARSHLLPLQARLGDYSTERLERLQRGPRDGSRPPAAVEFWAHEASIVPTRLLGSLQAVQSRQWVSASDAPEERDALIPLILETLEASTTPLTSRDLSAALEVEARRDRGHWGWNWAPLKHALGDLFQRGAILSAGRNAQFERCYVPAERLVGSVVVPDRSAAVRELVGQSLRSLGVGSVGSIADYYRLPAKETAAALEEMRASGEAEPVRVEGIPGLWWKDPAARPFRGGGVDALLSPFDSLVFHRRRLEDLWGMEYRLEFYVPAARRVHGYYVMPFLQGTRMTARFDLSLDRAAGVLRVLSCTEEPGADGDTPVLALAALRELAVWLGAGGVAIAESAPGAGRLRLAAQSDVD